MKVLKKSKTESTKKERKKEAKKNNDKLIEKTIEYTILVNCKEKKRYRKTRKGNLKNKSV